ncbi:MAG: hypothetical protein KF838_10035 [Phycisphaeraceae bacterium]|nr:MAG: hypothetical protein KF838_10035 [Phycisphaeraceae bacterium]
MASPRSKPEHPRSRGKPLGEDQLLPLARRVSRAADSPIVGGVAVMLHGGGRNTSDIDVYSDDFWETHQRLEAAGIMWDASSREHRVDGVAVRMVGPESLGGPPKRASTIKGVSVIGLADLVRGKLIVGLKDIKRSKDIAHVIDLIEAVPLDKSFAAKLPTPLRAPFKTLVDQVHEPRRTSIPPAAFRKRYAS